MKPVFLCFPIDIQEYDFSDVLMGFLSSKSDVVMVFKESCILCTFSPSSFLKAVIISWFY